MKWLSSILERFFPVRPGSVVLQGDDAWSLEGGISDEKGRDYAHFLTHAVSIFPDGSILYIEGASISPPVKSYLERNKVTGTCRVGRAASWPSPEVFHIPLTADTARELGTLCTGRPCRELCDHLHVYREGRLLLQGHDAGWSRLFVSLAIPKSRIAAFCGQTGYSYKLEAAI